MVALDAGMEEEVLQHMQDEEAAVEAQSIVLDTEAEALIPCLNCLAQIMGHILALLPNIVAEP